MHKISAIVRRRQGQAMELAATQILHKNIVWITTQYGYVHFEVSWSHKISAIYVNEHN